jgi:hypothetical protein
LLSSVIAASTLFIAHLFSEIRERPSNRVRKRQAGKLKSSASFTSLL